VREDPATVREHYYLDISAGVDVLCSLTAQTLPRALQQIGMPFRSAALTGCAVELALNAADLTPRPVIVAGVLGTSDLPPMAEERTSEELQAHAARLAAAGCEIILARGFDHRPDPPRERARLARLARRAAIAGAKMTALPTWAIVTLDDNGRTPDGEPADECAVEACEEGAHVVLFEVPTLKAALYWLDRLVAGGRHIGFALAADARPEPWAVNAKTLLDSGVRVLGGGVGTTHRHLGALSALLRGHQRQSIWPRAI
jgi:5-methyltetrahydrofolate--homocysteine methyltransferase